ISKLTLTCTVTRSTGWKPAECDEERSWVASTELHRAVQPSLFKAAVIIVRSHKPTSSIPLTHHLMVAIHEPSGTSLPIPSHSLVAAGKTRTSQGTLVFPQLSRISREGLLRQILLVSRTESGRRTTGPGTLATWL